MRVEQITLSWFRGAAETITLDPQSKSMVVYGENGSGKSSFVDAMEFVLKDGRIDHLAHEYSGRRQEKAIINTHIPIDTNTSLGIRFRNNQELTADIKPDGRHNISHAEGVALDAWDYARTILRQDEVANFIKMRKGDKYSALLPLLGLHHLEVMAENLRQLANTIERQSDIATKRRELEKVDANRKAAFGEKEDEQIWARTAELHAAYCPDLASTTDPLARCGDLEAAVSTRLNQYEADHKRYLALKAVGAMDLTSGVSAVRSANAALAEASEELIIEKLAVLHSASQFTGKLDEERMINCPACGQSILVSQFQSHVKNEEERLRNLKGKYETRKAAINKLATTVGALKSSLGKDEVQAWRGELAEWALADNLEYIDGFDPDTLRESCTEESLESLEKHLPSIIAAAAAASKDAPPEVQQLNTDKEAVEATKEMIGAEAIAKSVKGSEALIAFINSVEHGVRKKIRTESDLAIEQITVDIQRMWGILHPGQAIEDVKLYVPNGVDKAIDIGLRFYGHDQDSPRLTLSEGYRNSLGLCIFLAMAKREAEHDRPLFLDDVVVSLDRGHRGMIRELLEREFSDRQVIILTHDRDWYTELRQQLTSSNWTFKTLVPWKEPAIGISWSSKTFTFDDARALLVDHPDVAGNTARKIMDIECALIAQNLKTRMPYRHREKNDHRTVHEFLVRFAKDGQKCFRKKSTSGHEPYQNAVDTFNEVDGLLKSWGNRASHTFDIVQPEASRLIDVCERAIGFFYCPGCEKPVWKTDDSAAKQVQCSCGHLQWRYGKAS